MRVAKSCPNHSSWRGCNVLARTLEEPLGRVGEAMSVFPLAGVASCRVGGSGQRPASVSRIRQREFHPEQRIHPVCRDEVTLVSAWRRVPRPPGKRARGIPRMASLPRVRASPSQRGATVQVRRAKQST